MKLKFLFSSLSVGLIFSLNIGVTAQNLLDTSTWTIGTGSVAGYSQYGVTAENSRILGENHVGDEIILWQASPNSGGGNSGGFISPAVLIDHTKEYRLSVWIKKVNSNDGSTQFKPLSYTSGQYHTTYIDGTNTTWHPFWYGDLPMLDRWYLLVGFVHGSSSNATVSLGKIYDGVTGEAVVSMTDHKFKITATELQNRTMIWGDTTTEDRQYMHSPRIEEVNGFEWTLNQLLSLNPDSKLIFAYDVSGNQVQRFYCDTPSCVVPPPPSEAPPNNDEIIAEKQDENEKLDSNFQEELSIFPNPTEGIVTVKLNSSTDLKLTGTISIYSITGATVKDFNLTNSATQKELNLKSLPTGVYYIHMHFSDGNAVTKKLLKK